MKSYSCNGIKDSQNNNDDNLCVLLFENITLVKIIFKSSFPMMHLWNGRKKYGSFRTGFFKQTIKKISTHLYLFKFSEKCYTRTRVLPGTSV